VPEEADQPVALVADRRLERLPREIACCLYGFFVGRPPAVELRLARYPRLDDPVAHAEDAVELLLVAQPLLRLVALVAAAGGMALRLRQLVDMEEGRFV